jgi:hypothetical protein
MKLQLWQIKILIAITVLMSAIFWHKYEVKLAVNNAVAVQKAEYNKLIDEVKLKSSETESQLNKQVLNMEVKKNAEIKNLDRKYTSIVDSLRQRQERSTASNTTGNTCNPESPKGATGAELYREDAKFLIGFARDTEELKISLNQCYSQYDALKDSLEKFKK